MAFRAPLLLRTTTGLGARRIGFVVTHRNASMLARALPRINFPTSFRAASGSPFAAVVINRAHGVIGRTAFGAGGATWRAALGGGGAARNAFSTFPGAFGSAADDDQGKGAPPRGVVVDVQSRCVSTASSAAAAPLSGASGPARWVRPLSTGPSGGMKRSTTIDSFATAPRDDDAAAAAGGDTAETQGGGGGFFGAINRFLSRENIVAPPGYNRWLNVPASFLVQISIGSVYAWSIFNEPLTRQLGVVAAAGNDWGLTDVVPIFSACAVSLGVCTALLGPWAERAGPRKVATAAALAWGGGLALSGLGCQLHEIGLLYVGYGILGGAGWGLGYISPVSTLMKWFPDRRGMATGLALTAFGGGAMLATPVNELLLTHFAELPTYLGSADAVALVTEGGKRFAEVGGETLEVVVAGAADAAKCGVPGAREGVYVVGTGDPGVTRTFWTLAGAHTALMLTGAMLQKVPADGWTPEGWSGLSRELSTGPMMRARAHENVHHDTALRTPQFWLLWTAVWGNALAGVTVISCAKTLMGDCFGAAMPLIVTGAFASTYVAALSFGNMAGRLGWATASDWLGRKRTYYVFGLSIPLCMAIPEITNHVMTSPDPGTMPLVLFFGGTFMVVSFYGGLFSVLPAYIADVFGQKHAGAIHGRALTAWAAAALSGPSLMTYLRQGSYTDAANALAGTVDPGAFEQKFGAPVADLPALLEAKSVTISNLLEIAPAGTLDPTPGIYNTTMYSMGGILCCAVVCNALMGPVNPRHLAPVEEDDPDLVALRDARDGQHDDVEAAVEAAAKGGGKK